MFIFYDKGKTKIPVKIWRKDISNVEDSALEQIYNLSNLPFVFKHLAIMPDVHAGYGMPIGGIMATENVIVPNAVGVDIGCGVRAIKTHMKNIPKDDLKNIMEKIKVLIPMGFNKHNEMQNLTVMPDLGVKDCIGNTSIESEKTPNYWSLPIVRKEFDNAGKSIGTLGGGNHFIEIQKDENEYIWIMIHSGSRNLGKQVADYYNKIAIDLNKKWLSSVPKEYQLAFLPVDSKEGRDYLREMKYCIDFAFANRELMGQRICDAFDSLGFKIFSDSNNTIDVAHNYARLENHFGKNVWVHRKGAISAKEGELGIVPGSQGTKSYVVEGLGNPESFTSCSHGAGRKMSRTQAKAKLNLQEEIKLMNDQGIIHGIRDDSDLDEAPSAYKDIDLVMKNQKDLIRTLEKLTPLAVIKG